MNFIAILRYIKIFILELNLFESAASRSNRHHLRTAIISTRLYIILMTGAVVSLVLFTALEQKPQTITVRKPSQDVFEKLYFKYSTTLQCPCSQVEISYETFINISYNFHPVCSSVFVSDNWINLLFSPDMTYFFPLDFRSSATGQFQLLASLCLFANRSTQDATDDFLSSALLSPYVLSSPSLQNQSEAKSEFLKTSTTSTFRRLVNLIRGTTYMNGLQPAMQTSTMEILSIFPDDSLEVDPFQTIWGIDGRDECFCGVAVDCYSPVGFYEMFAEETTGAFDLTIVPLDTVAGFVVSCYALDALLQSTLECFFDSTCLTTVLAYFPTNNITGNDILNISQTLYPFDSTIEELVNNLFIEQWSSNISFSAYYSKCAPILCTYKIIQYSSILQILTTLLGVYGGLTIVLRICIPRVVRWWRDRKIIVPTDFNNTENNQPQRFRNMRRWIKVRMIEFNLFETNLTRTDAYELQTARIGTRVYLVALLLTLSIITASLLLPLRVQSVTIENPPQTIFEKLHDKYPSTLQCPCSRIVNSYELFTSLSPIYHPVCSSLFISYEWIISISSLNIINSAFDSLDFQVAGPAFFNTLATLCSLSNSTIDDAWYSFSQTPFITDLTLTQSEFDTRTQSAIEEFRTNTINEFNSILSLVDSHTKTMYATGYENVDLYTDQLSTTTSQINFPWMPVETDTCSCGLKDQCSDVMSFFSYDGITIYKPYNLSFTLPDIFIGCFVVPSVLQSSLSCFFNQTCLDRIQLALSSKRRVDMTILDVNSTRFSPHSLIGTILDDLMVESWNEKILYDEYYEQCAPEQCTYTYTSHNNPFQIVTTTVGLFGGLSVVLKLIVPLIISWIRKLMRRRKETNTSTDRSANPLRTKVIWRVLKTRILQLNVFRSELTLDDDQRRRTEIITTRIYLLLLTLAVIILIIYTCIDTQTQTVKILNPSIQQFDQLRFDPQYSATLDCPCQNIIVPYQSFISIKPYYHQLCSSDFVAADLTWISLLYSSRAGTDYSYDDYHIFAAPQFQLLSAFCSLANETFTEAIFEFSTNVLTSGIIQSSESIKTQTDSILNQFILSTPRTFVRTLDFIRYMAQGNGIVSSIFSNWHFVSLNTDIQWATVWAKPLSYSNDSCSCGTNAMCTSEASFNGLIVPGFRVGCYPLEALLQSTLECLYNISCINQLKSMYNQSNIIFNPLNASLSSPNITVQSLVDKLLVEEWETSVVYEQYYSTCAPLSCTYTFDGQINLIYTVTTIIGLYGGLTVAFKLMCPVLVRIGYYVIRRRQQQVQQMVTVIRVEH